MAIETIIQNLQKIVDEWKEASEGENLEDIKASVKWILDNVCSSLGIEPDQIMFKFENTPSQRKSPVRCFTL